MNDREFDGKDLDDALGAAGHALGRPVAGLDYELLEGGRKGVFGLGARPVRIRVKDDPLASGLPPRREVPPGKGTPLPSASSPASGALRRMIELMGLAVVLEEVPRQGSVEIVLDGPDRKRLTAKDGELLQALEFVLNRMARRQWPDAPPVRVVCRGFTSERDEDLVALVREVAAEVARSGVPKRLEAMNPYERRVVHVTAREYPGLTTVSEGDGFLKRVRVEKAGS